MCSARLASVRRLVVTGDAVLLFRPERAFLVRSLIVEMAAVAFVLALVLALIPTYQNFCYNVGLEGERTYICEGSDIIIHKLNDLYDAE